MTATKRFVVPAGRRAHLDMSVPGWVPAVKLFDHEAEGSIMMFEETVSPGTRSWLHPHHDSDWVASMLEAR